MAEKRDPAYSSNKGKNRQEEEREQVLLDEVEEKNMFEKLKENKKITVPLFVILVLGGIIYLFSPGKDKEEPKKKADIQTAENINLDMLENRKTEDEEADNNYQSNQNQQEYFSYDDSNLQTYNAENTSDLNMPKDNRSDYTYGNYPSYYDTDELPGDGEENIKKEQSGKKLAEKGKNIPISFDRKQANTATQPADQEGQPQQSQGGQKFQLSSGLTAPVSKYEIKTGELIPAVLVTGIDSDLAGNITAIVSQDVFDSIKGKYLLIPKGSKLYGTYDSGITYGQNRLMLIWQRIILPNGYSINLETMQGIDITGQAGIKGKVNNHTLKLLRSIILSSVFNFISSGVSVSADKKLGGNGKTDISVGATVGGKVADDTSSKLQSAGDMIIERDLNQQPTIKIKAGTKFSVMVNNDMVLMPYNKLKRKK
ncbi:MAG: TrbI/VirB10 family protein [Fusobacteriales bacterium]|jgi:type IV secretion system protein VirB10|nr:TrbI/VirB10 family protein [Fusobacteriales bacterium]